MHKRAVALVITAALTFTSSFAPWADEIMAEQGWEMEEVIRDMPLEEDVAEEEWEGTIQVFHDVQEEGKGDYEDEDYGDLSLIEDLDPDAENVFSLSEEETEQEEGREAECEALPYADIVDLDKDLDKDETEQAAAGMADEAEVKTGAAAEEAAGAAVEEETEAVTEEETEVVTEEAAEAETEECSVEIDEEEVLFEDYLEEEAEEELIEAAASFEDVSTKIYFLDPAYQNSLQIPSSYPQEYQIDLTGIGNPRIVSARADGSYSASSQVSEAGLVTLKPTYWHRSGYVWISGYLEGGENRIEYNTGTMIYRVYDGSDLKFTVTVEAADYAEIACLEHLKQAEDSIDTSQGDYQTFVNIVKYVAENYSYSASYSSARGMILSGGGDCWASTDMIISMGKALGLDIRSRKANHDPGAGSGHNNALAKINGKYYVGEAGFTGTKPRYYDISEEPGGFAFYYGRIYQYDGDDDVVTIPSEINGRSVTTLGYTNDTGGVFTRGKAKVTAVNIPATVTSIYDAAFFDASYLTQINVDPENTNYKSVDGVLYSKDGATLIKVPNAKEELTIPEGVTTLNRLSLDYCTKLKTLELPSTLTTIGEGAFYYMSGCTITIPASVTEIGDNAFKYMSKCAIQVEEGSYAASYCEENGIHAETYTVNGNGTKEVSHLWDEGVQETAPTCEEEGTLVFTCSVCGYKRYEAIPALGHDYEVVDRQEPDCTNAGHIRHYHCARCDRHFAKDDAATAAEEQAFALPALGHDMVVTEPAEAACTEAGTKGYYTCSRCNGVFADAEGTVKTTVAARAIRATGHDPVYHSAKGATCTQEGNQYYYECENCDKIFLDWRGQTETTIEERTVAPLGHSIGRVPGYDATCTADGRVEYWKCYRCNELFSDEALENTITAEETVIPAYGHLMSKVEAAEPTCTQNGTLGYYSCSRCSGTFADEEGTERTTVYKMTLWAPGHDLTCHSPNSPTCLQAGNHLYYECANCGHLYQDRYGTNETAMEEITIPALGHSIYLVEGKPATCAEEGCLTHYACSACGNCYSDAEGSAEIAGENVIVPKTSHTWSDYVIYREASCTEEGVSHRRCSVCGAFDKTVSIPVPATGHRWASVYTVDTAATMEKEGSKSIHCLRCGEKKAGSEVKIARTEPVTIRKKVAKVKAKTKRGKVTVSWKKLPAKVLKKNKISGIQIRVAQDRTFLSIVKDKRIGKNKKAWKFSAKKGTFYVKTRYYGPDGYSKWSRVRRVIIK